MDPNDMFARLMAMNLNQGSMVPPPVRGMPRSYQSSAFNRGERVVLLRSVETDNDEANPIWGKHNNYIAGTIIQAVGLRLVVDWDNGARNGYDLNRGDQIIKLEDAQKIKKAKNVKLDTSQLDPLIIDDQIKKEIIALLKQFQHKDKLFEEWGLGEVIEYGRGMTMMFHGNPGTGKTWGANCIAKACGTDLLVLNAGNIQTSEPGGANRNIENAFKTAKEKGQVLFLDECDSLITVRSEVGMILSSEINTLLTEIEKFEGVCILATNRIDTLDEALERRIALIIEFPEPDFDARLKIWKKLIPKKLPLNKDVSIDKLAEEKLTGGQIKNAVLQSARLAIAENADAVAIEHFDKAIQRIHASRSLMGKGSLIGKAKIKQDYVKG